MATQISAAVQSIAVFNAAGVTAPAFCIENQDSDSGVIEAFCRTESILGVHAAFARCQYPFQTLLTP